MWTIEGRSYQLGLRMTFGYSTAPPQPNTHPWPQHVGIIKPPHAPTFGRQISDLKWKLGEPGRLCLIQLELGLNEFYCATTFLPHESTFKVESCNGNIGVTSLTKPEFPPCRPFSSLVNPLCQKRNLRNHLSQIVPIR